MEAETVQVGILAFQAVLLALFGYLTARIRSVRKDVQDTHRQVVNDNPKAPNMRDEFDHRHKENTRALRWIGYTLVQVMADIAQLQTASRRNRMRIHLLERDHPAGTELDTAPVPAGVILGDVPDDVIMPWDENQDR